MLDLPVCNNLYESGSVGAGLSGAVEESRAGLREGRLGRGLARGAGTLAAGTVQVLIAI